MQRKLEETFDSCGNPINGIGVQYHGLAYVEEDDDEIDFYPIVSKPEPKHASLPNTNPVEPKEKSQPEPPQEGLGLEPATPMLVSKDPLLVRMRSRLRLFSTKKLSDAEFRQKVSEKFNESIALLNGLESGLARKFCEAITDVRNTTMDAFPAIAPSSSDRKRAMRIATATYEYVYAIKNDPKNHAQAKTTFQNRARYYTRTFRILAVACAALLVAGAIFAATFFPLAPAIAAGKISALVGKLIYIGAPTLFGGASMVATERYTRRDDDNAIKQAVVDGEHYAAELNYRDRYHKGHRR